MDIPQIAKPAVINNIIFTSLSLTLVALRILSRAFVIKKFGADDYLIISATLAAVGFLITVMLQIQHGLGTSLAFQQLPEFLKTLWMTVVVYNIAQILCKMSIVMQYYRIFRTPKMQRILKGMFLFLVVYGLWAILGTSFTCVPVEAYWNLLLEAKCMNRNAVTYSNAGLNIATDVIVLCIPLPLIKGLMIPTRQKIIVMGVFACGAFACVTSVIRLRSLYAMDAVPPERQSVDGVNIAIWSCIEINVAIMCACAPALKPLAVRLFPRLLLSSFYGRTRRAADGSGQGGSGEERSATECRSTTGHGSSGGKSQTTVQKSFEMNAARADDGRATSQAGSEEDLFADGG